MEGCEMNFDLSKINFSRFDLKRGLKLPRRLDEKLAEDMGIMVGDGSIGKIVRPKRAVDYQIMCYGNAITDSLFYGNYVKNLKKDLFNLNFQFSNKPKNTCELRINSKGLLEFYTKIIGLPLGRKGNLRVPLLIMNSTNKIKSAFIRGLADSDFSFTFRRKSKNIMYYPLIKLQTISNNLVSDLKNILEDMHFKTTTSYGLKSIHPLTKSLLTNHQISLNGKYNLERWMTNIKFNNPKNILKYNLWKKHGFCPDDKEIRKLMGTGSGGFEPLTY